MTILKEVNFNHVIETKYNGYHFRSRGEARYAFFWDLEDINYVYESDGYKLPSGQWFLPDFMVERYGAFVEIKATGPTTDVIQKCNGLSLLFKKKKVLLFIGDPLNPNCFIFDKGVMNKYDFSHTNESKLSAIKARSERFESNEMNWPKAA